MITTIALIASTLAPPVCNSDRLIRLLNEGSHPREFAANPFEESSHKPEWVLQDVVVRIRDLKPGMSSEEVHRFLHDRFFRFPGLRFGAVARASGLSICDYHVGKRHSLWLEIDDVSGLRSAELYFDDIILERLVP